MFVVVVALVAVVVSCTYGMTVRREIRQMSDEEVARFFEAMRVYKESGRQDGGMDLPSLDYAVGRHAIAKGNTTKDQAHFGLAFLLWHAAFLREVEVALQSIDANVSIPYWDWTIDQQLEHPEESVLFTSRYFGDANPVTHIVETGALANWSISDDPLQFIPWESPAGLLRGPGNRNPHPFLTRKVMPQFTLPSQEVYASCLSRQSFGDFNMCIDPLPPSPNPLHGAPHFFSGGFWGPGTNAGDASDVHTAPNDPIFFVHHAQLDRLYYRWRLETGEALVTEDDPCGNFYGEQRNPQPPGHNINDVMYPSFYTFRDNGVPLTLGDVCYYLHSERIPYRYE